MNKLLAAFFAATLATAGAIAQDKPGTATAPAAQSAKPTVAAASKTPEKKAEKKPRGSKPRKVPKAGGAASGAK